MKDEIIRIDPGFKRLLQRITKERIKTDIDMRPRSTRRLTMAINRHPSMTQIEKDIIHADLDAEGRR